MPGVRLAIRAPGIVLCALLACITTPAPAHAAPMQEAPTERDRAIVAAAFDRWAAGGSDFFNEVLAPDVVWTIKGSGPSAGTYRGRDELMERAVRPLASRLRTPVRPVSRRIWADGDHVVIHWEGEAVARDGKPYTNSYAWIFRMERGRATEVTAFLDLVSYDDVLRRIPRSERQGSWPGGSSPCPDAVRSARRLSPSRLPPWKYAGPQASGRTVPSPQTQKVTRCSIPMSACG